MAKIEIRGARVNTLKNIDLDIPKNQLVVITGVSGSGKSSLAFGTVFAEGQMRYVESLSSFARQFLGQRGHPDVDRIDGLSPAIAIEQKTASSNPRSTVGTMTEIYDYLRILWAKIGQQFCPECGREIRAYTVSEILEEILDLKESSRFDILSPLSITSSLHETVRLLNQQGFMRIRIGMNVYRIDEIAEETDFSADEPVFVVIDRLRVHRDHASRIADSLETALKMNADLIYVYTYDDQGMSAFSTRRWCPICDRHFNEHEASAFSFNNASGACPTCFGIGSHQEVDIDLLVPDSTLSLKQGAVVGYAWKNYKPGSLCYAVYNALSEQYHFSLDAPFSTLSPDVQSLLFFGTGTESVSYQFLGEPIDAPFGGIVADLEKRYHSPMSFKSTKNHIAKVMSDQECRDCHGERLSSDIRAVKINGLSLPQFCAFAVPQAIAFLECLELTDRQHAIADSVIQDIQRRLHFLDDVGLEYLTLSRPAETLSGGEAQRIRLASQLGSALSDVIYVLDEPSIGLHQKDNQRLLNILKRIKDLGNTVLVVEHDDETIREADWIIDIGPKAGEAGGYVVAQGSIESIMKEQTSITGQYLSHRRSIPVPVKRRKGNGKSLVIKGAAANNLKHIDVSIPLNTLICVSGVSGSGKSSLVNDVLYRELVRHLNRSRLKKSACTSIVGIEALDKVIALDQQPIGRSSRSNPATYSGVFDDIRAVFAKTKMARMQGYSASRFSFNVKGGRCEACEGEGMVKIAMNFLPDVMVECSECHGKRYTEQTLEVTYKGKNIADVLAMSASEASDFFAVYPKIHRKLAALCDVGLGYIRLGQSSTTLSGGEAQRVKLASELMRPQTGNTIYILDEPTTGLHSDDVRTLIRVLDQLVDLGNTVLVIEHNLDVVKCADYSIDLGPAGGEKGGYLLCSGTPEEIALHHESSTGKYLRPLLTEEE